MIGESAEQTVVIGTKGRLTIETPGHCPTKFTVALRGAGRGSVGSKLTFEYPIPADTEEIVNAGGYFYPNSAGFAYEAAAVARCIKNGKTEAPQYTLQETLINIWMLDEIRGQLGVEPFVETTKN
mmetsp:Transcript_7405/g.16842  ORF Transcript_7405/g.16842 Transcript_7405/m.16842 type:complete len:125 (-) Transcript_7405:531-905(-)